MVESRFVNYYVTANSEDEAVELVMSGEWYDEEVSGEMEDTPEVYDVYEL